MKFAVKNSATGKLVGSLNQIMATIPDIRDAEKYPDLVKTFPDAESAEMWADRHTGAGYGLNEYEVVEFLQT